jgi:hypothetical protein
VALRWATTTAHAYRPLRDRIPHGSRRSPRLAASTKNRHPWHDDQRFPRSWPVFREPPGEIRYRPVRRNLCARRRRQGGRRPDHHEGQLTYAKEGFVKVVDLGEWWKSETGLPLPLGGNVIRKDLTPEQRSEINKILHESIRYGLEHRAAGVAHAMPLARGLDTALADQFIGMYVNDVTLDYGDRGRAAIREFLARGHAIGMIPEPVELEFVK